jgi:hypothetical protein
MAHSLDTTAVHAGRHDLTTLGVHALPIDLSSTNPLPSIVEGGDSYENLATGGRLAPGQSPVYSGCGTRRSPVWSQQWLSSSTPRTPWRSPLAWRH